MMRRAFAVLVLAGLTHMPVSLTAAMDPADQQSFADGLYGRKLYEMAIQEYLRIPQEAPTYPNMDVVFFRVAEAYRYLDNKPAAQRYYSRVIAEFPESSYRFRSEFRRAEMFLTAGDYEEAVNRFRALLDRRPPAELAASSQYYLGYALKRMAKTKEGESALRLLLDRYPDSPYAAFACLELAELYREQKVKPDVLRDLYRRAARNGPTDRVKAEGLFQLADLAFQAGDYPEAAASYGKLLEAYPGDSRAEAGRFPAAWARYYTGSYDQALALADAALRKPGDREMDWLYLRANALRQKNDLAGAARAYDRLLEQPGSGQLAVAAAYERALVAFKDRNHRKVIDLLKKHPPQGDIQADGYWLMAESLRAAGETREAETWYERILKEFSKDGKAPEAAYQLASLRMNRGDWSGAAKDFSSLASTWIDSPRAPSALYAAGVCLVRAGDRDSAVSAWKTLLEFFPQDAQAADARYQQGVAEMQLDRPADADATLAAYLKQHPDGPRVLDARYWLAVLAEQRGDDAAAEKGLKKLLETDASDELASRARFRLAAVLQKQGREEEAADLIQTLMGRTDALELPPALVEWLARHRLEQKRHDDAAAAADYLVQHAPEPAWKQIGWYLGGLSRERAGRSGEADQAYRHALEIDAKSPEGARAALRLGTLLVEKGQTEAAVPFLEKAGEWAAEPALADIRAQAYFGLGRAAEYAGDWHRANRYYMSVAILYDDPKLAPEALYKAAVALGKLDKQMERRRTLAELLERYPDSEWARKVKEP